MNEGKKFEAAIKKSVPDYALVIRLNDSAQAFKQSNLARFTPKNPCDYIVFDSEAKTLYCLELKTTKSKSITFEDIYSDKEESKMIHKHQIMSLREFSNFKNVIAGFIFNFRDDINNMERTYFQRIEDFLKMCRHINKKSFNELDLLVNNAVVINGIRKKVNYTWDIDSLFKHQMEV